MKLTKEEFKYLLDAVEVLPSSVGLTGMMMDAIIGKSASEEEKKELKDRNKKGTDEMQKKSAIILGKLYQMESEIVESCE